jgi:hypothetical protein
LATPSQELLMPRIALAGWTFVLSVAAPALPGQDAPTPPPPPTFRQRLDGMFRGSAPAPRQVECNGSIIAISDLTARSEEAAADPSLHNQELLILAALTEQLRRDRLLPGEDALAQAFADYRKDYDSTPFTTEVIATRFKGYPSLAAFEHRWRVCHAFERTIAGSIDRKALQAEADAQREFLGDARVAVDLWFYSAFDQAQDRWDFAAAERRAQQGRAALQSGRDADTVRKDSDAVQGVGGWPGVAVSYNALRTTMGESEYTDLVQGTSAAATVFHGGKPGEVVGPLRSVRGFWLARVERRIPAPKRFEVADGRSEELVRQVLVQRRFLEWADAVLAKSVLRAQ